MPRLRLAAAALNQTPLAWDANRDHILAAIAAAQQAQVGVLCLPELCISGYGCEDMFFSAGVRQTSLDLLLEIVPHTSGLAVAIGLPLEIDGKLTNAAALVCDGQLAGFVCKQRLAGDGIHYEPRWFHPWPRGQTTRLTIAGNSVPAGDLLLDCGGVRIGMEICRDAWIADRPGALLAARGANVLLNPSASHFAFAKQEIRRQLVLDAAREYRVAYAYANLLGNESGRAIYDGGTLIASGEELLAAGPRFSFDDFLLTMADVELESTQRTAADEISGGTVSCEFELTSPNQPHSPAPPPVWDTSPPSKEEEFTRSMVLGLFDYLRKSHAGGLVVSLSGGADSAAVAVLVYLMVRLGAAELELDRLVARLPDVSRLKDLNAEATDSPINELEVVGRLLTCVYQSTRNSSETTRTAAQQLAQAIGAEFLQWDVDLLVDGYLDTVAQAVGREPTWEQDDLALQNIQARARAPAVWLLANLRGALLLATSNRSEAAVGYATMDGDTCGGLAPIAGIDKAFLLDWLKWMETTGPAGIGPLPALAVINVQQPTAELRPPSAGQTDESDLMPYQVLDAIERAAIRDKLTPLEVLHVVQQQQREYTLLQLGQWVERFFQLWCRNQWKRERYAPSFHLDDENLDPKTWCRFPILSGGFERELAELREYLRRDVGG